MASLNSTATPPKFVGEFRHKVEGKGRITIPAKWRFEEDVEIFMIGRSLKRCISAFTLDELKRKEAAIASEDEETRSDMLDQLGESLRQATLDKAGRITIPDDLCREFGLSGEVWLSGAVNTFNIWNVADFEAAKVTGQPRKTTLLRKFGL